MDLKVTLITTLFALFSISGVIVADDPEPPAGDKKLPEFNVNKELGYFSKCKGKDVNYPPNLIAAGGLHVIGCQTSLDYVRASNKYCVGVCVMQRFEYLFFNMTYNYEAAVKPLYDAVKEGTMDKDVVDIQAAALKRCSDHGQVFSLDDDCEEAKFNDDCIRTAQATDCGPATGA